MLTIEQELRAEIRERGMTIREAAETAGITPAALYTALERDRIGLEQYMSLRRMLRDNPPEGETP